MGGDESPLLLRLKARAGDAEPPVLGQVFESLFRLEGPEAIGFIARFLDDASGDVQGEAALALAGSRRPEALEALEAAYLRTHDRDSREILVRAISAARQDRGFDFLLKIVRNGRAAEACAALEALALHRESPEIWRRVEDTVKEAGTAAQARFRNLTASGG
jgi:HEAT repeat protein